jgi:trehalose 6-phosphate phosphatase
VIFPREGRARPRGARAALPPPEPGWAYFFDIDGTLVTVADAPHLARLEPRFRRVLEDLYRWCGGAVALISGRAISDTDRMFEGLRFPAAGQHGLERRDSAGRLSRPAIPPAGMEHAREQLAAVAERHRGLLLEDKGHSLALHYRQAPQLGGYAHRIVRVLVSRLGPAWVVQPGKRVVELRPAGSDKGAAVLEFMHESPFRGRTPVFVGDDATDEHGFAFVNSLAGHSVKVGPGPTSARWRLPDVPAVRAWLERGVAERAP